MQKRMCHFKVTNQSDERISWISPDQVFESTTVGHMLYRSGEMQHNKTTKLTLTKEKKTLKLSDYLISTEAHKTISYWN